MRADSRWLFCPLVHGYWCQILTVITRLAEVKGQAESEPVRAKLILTWVKTILVAFIMTIPTVWTITQNFSLNTNPDC